MYVTKRSGKLEPVNLDKIREVISYACDGLDVNPLELEGTLSIIITDKIPTSKLQESLIHQARSLANAQNPHWLWVAGRLAMMDRWHTTCAYDIDFQTFFADMLGNGYNHEILRKYTKRDLAKIDKMIIQERDLVYSYAAVSNLTKKYLLPDECPQQMFMATAMVLADGDLDRCQAIYDALSQRKISLATPWLGNLRKGGNIASCFVLAVDDDLDSIYGNLHNMARISKNGGGIGCFLGHLRASGSSIQNHPNASKGVVPFTRVINDTMVYIDQLGKRPGAATVSLPVWHADIMDFIEVVTEHGDIRTKAHDIFPQVTMVDLFMRRVESGGDWTMVCPYEVKQVLGIDINDVYGSDFTQAYRKVESAFDSGRLTVGRKLPAKDILKRIMQIQVETGLPYIAFIDEIQRQNPNKHDGKILSANLCVTADTKILVKDGGYRPISEMVGTYQSVWNGEEWSDNVLIRQTNDEADIIEVHTDSGHMLRCTKYHRFVLSSPCGEKGSDGYYRRKEKIVEAKDLKPGDQLIKFDLPVVDGFVEYPDAYRNGFFCADGYEDRGGNRYIYLYEDKIALADYLGLTDTPIYTNPRGQKLVRKRVDGLLPKYTVPTGEHTIKSRLDWFAGLLDGDGCLLTERKHGSQTLQLSSVNMDFLRDVQMMLQTLGVNAKICKGMEAGVCMMPDSNGNPAPYHCNRSWRLIVTTVGLYQLVNLGLVTHRLQINVKKPNRDASRYVKITKIVDKGEREPTYCFTEPKRNRGMFNGICTMQCVESYSNVKSDTYAHTCSLASIVLGNHQDHDDIVESAKLTAWILDRGFALTNAPIDISRAHMDRYRTIGVGIMGLHDWLVKQGTGYHDLDAISKVGESVLYGAIQTSIEIAKETQPYPAYKGSMFETGELTSRVKKHAKLYDWDEVQSQIDKYGVAHGCLTMIAPTGSTSLIMDSTAGHLPVYAAYYTETNKAGSYGVCPWGLHDHQLAYAKGMPLYDQRQIVDITAALMPYITAGVSMELVMDWNRLTPRDMYDIIMHAWRSKIKTIYYIRSIERGSDISDLLGGKEVACVGCSG